MVLELSARAVILVAAGSAIGGTLRYLVQTWLARPEFPWGTVAVNLIGSFLIGAFLFSSISTGTAISAETRVFVAVGLLGGFTTMSAFAYETLVLAEGMNPWRSLAYAALTMAGCLVMVVLGRFVARLPGGVA